MFRAFKKTIKQKQQKKPTSIVMHDNVAFITGIICYSSRVLRM